MPRPEERRWSPLLMLTEPTAGIWHYQDEHQPYAIIRLIRRGDELGYVAHRWTPTGDGDLIGYYVTLEASARQVAQYRRDQATAGAR